MQAVKLRIGTRGSPLALAQAHEVKHRLIIAHGLEPVAIEIIVINTSGDMFLDRPLADIGGKGLFTKEIEEALLANRIDLAVHSMKDVPTVLPVNLEIAAVLPREDVRDAFISINFASLAGLPAGSVVGTSSLRRQAQLRALRPDLKVEGFRGNVQTRLKKLENGVASATFLAVAGLRRLGLEDKITQIVPPDEMLPAVAQGAIGIEIRSDDTTTRTLIDALNDRDTAIAVSAERSFLGKLEGSCRTPIAGHASVQGMNIVLKGQLLAPDGSAKFDAEASGAQSDAAGIGHEVADRIIAQAGAKFLESIKAP